MRTKTNNQNNSRMLFPHDRDKDNKAFRSLSLVDQILMALEEDILTGELKGGDQLLEDRLKDRFRVSRTPLKEAFRVLEKEGLVETLSRRGTFVKRITGQNIEEDFPIRGSVKGLAARLLS